jgi:MFS family permease
MHRAAPSALGSLVEFAGRVAGLGRRKLLLTGLVGMGVSLVVVGIAFRFIGQAPAGAAAAAATGPTTAGPTTAGPTTAGIVTMLALVVCIICFAFSMGPVVWTVINEIFPGYIRGRAVAVATAVNWAATFVVSQTFVTLIGTIGNTLTFWLFALFCGISWIWIFYRVPETKGQSLEQIQQIWKQAGT